MTPARRAEIEARAAKAAPGPWEYSGIRRKNTFYHDQQFMQINCRADGGFVFLTWDDDHQPQVLADLKFIAHARRDIPDLLSALDERDAEIERLRRSVAEWELALEDL